jgi:hypothetical protein
LDWSTTETSHAYYERVYEESSTTEITTYKRGYDLKSKIHKAIEKKKGFNKNKEGGDDKALSDDEENIESKKTIPIKGYKEKPLSYFVIGEEHQVIPSVVELDYEVQVEVLNKIRDGSLQEVFNNGRYKIIIEKEKVHFTKVLGRDDGKTVGYAFEWDFDGSPPYPKLIVKHVIPNLQFFKSEIDTMRIKLKKLEESKIKTEKHMQICSGELVAYRQEKILQGKKAIDLLESIEVKKEEIQTHQLENFITLSQEKINKFTVDLSGYHKAKEKLQQQQGTLEKQQVHLEFKRKRLALFIESQTQQLERAVELVGFFNSQLEIASKRMRHEYKDKFENILERSNEFLSYYNSNKESLFEEINVLLNRKQGTSVGGVSNLQKNRRTGLLDDEVIQ